jgi:hypothetical protein
MVNKFLQFHQTTKRAQEIGGLSHFLGLPEAALDRIWTIKTVFTLW